VRRSRKGGREAYLHFFGEDVSCYNYGGRIGMVRKGGEEKKKKVLLVKYIYPPRRRKRKKKKKRGV